MYYFWYIKQGPKMRGATDLRKKILDTSIFRLQNPNPSDTPFIVVDLGVLVGSESVI